MALVMRCPLITHTVRALVTGRNMVYGFHDVQVPYFAYAKPLAERSIFPKAADLPIRNLGSDIRGPYIELAGGMKLRGYKVNDVIYVHLFERWPLNSVRAFEKAALNHYQKMDAQS